MKVYIGPYTRWIGPYQIADLLQYIGVSEDRCHAIGHWLAERDGEATWLAKLCSWIESKKKRNIKIQIDKYDTWSMDSTLALIVLPMLKQLKAEKHGAPGTMPAFEQTSNSDQYCFPFYADCDSEAWSAGHDQWDAIMDEMIWTFEQLQPDYDWEDQYWIVHPEIDFADRPEDDGKVAIPVRWKVKGECDWVGRQRHQERIDEGLRLFGQYYQSLWD